MHNKENNIMPVNTDRTITANRPNIIIKDSVNSTCKLIDITVPSNRNIVQTKTEKKQVQRPRLEIQKIWHIGLL